MTYKSPWQTVRINSYGNFSVLLKVKHLLSREKCVTLILDLHKYYWAISGRMDESMFDDISILKNSSYLSFHKAVKTNENYFAS